MLNKTGPNMKPCDMPQEMAAEEGDTFICQFWQNLICLLKGLPLNANDMLETIQEDGVTDCARGSGEI